MARFLTAGLGFDREEFNLDVFETLGEGGWMVRDGEELKRILVECLEKEEGEATQDGLLHAHQRLKGLSRRELSELAGEFEEIEVLRKRYRPWDERDVTIILRLKGFEGKSDPAHMSREVNVDRPLAFIRCEPCG